MTITPCRKRVFSPPKTEEKSVVFCTPGAYFYTVVKTVVFCTLNRYDTASLQYTTAKNETARFFLIDFRAQIGRIVYVWIFYAS